MDPIQIISAGVIVAAACALQSMVGFGAGLFGIPLLVWSGMTLPDAITVTVVAAGVQVSWGAWRYRHEIPWRPILPLILYRFLTLPLGVAALGVVVMIGRDAVQQAVGWGLLTVVAIIQLSRVEPRERVGGSWGAAVGLSSGFLSGLLGMGGPPIVLWVMAHDWNAHRARAALWVLSMTGIPVTLLLLGWRFGGGIADAAWVGLICIPFMLLGSLLGFRFNGRFSRVRLRQASVALLVLIAVGSIVSPMLREEAPVVGAVAAEASPPARDE